MRLWFLFSQLKNCNFMSNFPINNSQYNQPPQPLYDSLGNLINQPTNLQQGTTNSHYNIQNASTGTEKIVYKQTPQGFVFKEKSSYHDPVSGVSEKISSTTKGREGDVIQNRSRSRSSSSERKRKLNSNVGSTKFQNTQTFSSQPQTVNPAPYTPPVPHHDTSAQYNYPSTTNQPISTPTMNYQPPTSNPPMSYNTNETMRSYQQTQYTQPTNYNQQPNVINKNIGMAPVATTMPLSYHDPFPQRPLAMHDPNKFIAEEKGTIKTTATGTKTSEKLTYIDPVTGYQQNAKITTKITGDRSRSRSQGKSKTAYSHKVQDTAQGPKVEIKQKHREGGIMANIKNKLHNMMNH